MGFLGFFGAIMAIATAIGRLFELFSPAEIVEKRILIKKKLYPMFGIIERRKSAGNPGDTVGFTSNEYKRLKHIAK